MLESKVAVKMNKHTITIIITFWFVCLLAVSAVAGPQDCQVSGTVKIDGQEALAGTLVEAYIDGELIVSKRTVEDGKYEITIPKYDPGNPAVKGYQSESDVVTLKVDQREAEPKFYARPGTQKINLQVKTTLNVRLTTWGKIKALFK
jgi:hypothetical protein